MSRYDAIFASAPLNRTAAIVTSGGSENDDLTWEQKRQNLCDILARIEYIIKTSHTPAVRKRFGVQKLHVQNLLRELNQSKPPPPSREGFPQAFVDMAREMLAPALFAEIRDVALRKARENSAAIRARTAEQAA